MSDEARYTFVPWARAGYRPTNEGDGTVGVTVSVEGDGEDGTETKDASVDLALYGPGEVTGIDHQQVVRTEPTSGTSDFPPNHFPLVEFDYPELPWLFSPDAEDVDGKFRPWFCLITVEQTEGVSLQTGTDGPAAVLDIRAPASPGEHLPDPSESWAWAHSQVVGADDVEDELETDRSVKTLSRLLSPRRLEPQKSYYACVVPTYEPGKRAGLGKEPFERDDEGNVVRSYEDAWDPDAPPDRIRLPVYYHWEFSTGKAGDFESLVRRLDPQVLEDVGVRQVDAGDPGPDALQNDGEVVTLEGALRSANTSPDTYSDGVRTQLVNILDESSALAPESAVPGDAEGDRVLGPPIYGQWPPATAEVPVEGAMPEWLRDLNEDPRFRIPAAFGTEVVQDKQEQLMAEAWRQVGDIREANQKLRRARLTRAASQQIHDTMAGLSPAALLALTEPAHRRTLDEDAGQTISAAVDESALPSAVLSPAFRRITRPNGPLSRRLGGIRRERIVEDVNDREMDLGDDGSPPDGVQVMGEDLASDLCTLARSEAGGVGDWDLLGDPHRPPATAVDDVREHCRRVLERIESAMRRLEDNYDAGVELEEMLADLNPICSEHALEDTELDTLQLRVRRGDPGEILESLVAIEDALTAAGGRFETLESMAESDARLDELLAEDPGVSPAFEAYRAAVALLWVRLIVDRLFEYSCRSAHKALASIEVEPNGEASSLLAELEDLCAILCGDEDALAGLLAALLSAVDDGDPREIRDVVAAMTQLIGVARPRLSRLAEVPHDGPLGALVEACERIDLYLKKLRRRLEDAPWDPVAAAVGPRVCPRPEAEPDPPLDLPETAAATRDATDPTVTIPNRLGERLDGLDLSEREYPLAPIMAHPEFDEPMFGALRDLGQEKLVPGVGEIPLDSVGVLETNPEFVESYMLGLSHEMARELRWREYPTDLRGTYFRQFWDPRGRDPPLTGEERRDIDYVHEWEHDRELGDNYETKMAAKGGGGSGNGGNGDGDSGGQLVLVVRGALFDRYPNTHVYAAKGESADDDEDLKRRPRLPDPFDDEVEGRVEHPVFRGTLDPDITFFGFDLDHGEAVADPGWFFVIEEPPSGPSFGLDVAVEREEDSDWTWEDLTWEDVTVDDYVSVTDEPSGDGVPDTLPTPPEWRRNGAHMGEITWIRPFRAAIHADDMLPTNGGSG